MSLVGIVDQASIRVTGPHVESESWLLAHEGVIDDIGLLRPRISQRRALHVRSDTDRESLLAFLLSNVDASDGVDAGLVRAIGDIESSGVRGSFNFVVTNGSALYAYRSGRPLVLLVRPDAVLVASEPLTDEAWRPLCAGALLRVDRAPLAWRFLAGYVEVDASGPELPFTD